MRLTTKQQKDLVTIKYFIPNGLVDKTITDRDIEMFFEYSEKGLHKELLLTDPEYRWEINKNCTDGFWALCQGKIWRGVHVGMYEQGILDGSIPYFQLFLKGQTPIEVVQFMSKEMFQGVDKEMIMDGFLLSPEEFWNKKIQGYKERIALKYKQVI